MTAAKVDIIIPWYGDPQIWRPLAERALASAANQTVDALAVTVVEGDSVSHARNEGVKQSQADWLIFLDADDELDPCYVEAMVDAQRASGADLIQPSTLGVVDGREDPFPVLIPAKPLLDGNYIVCGAMVRRDLFLKAGGFRELAMFEDWDLWIRCWLEGAKIAAAPAAIYRVHVRPNSRNNQHRDLQVQSYHQIRNAYLDRTPA